MQHFVQTNLAQCIRWDQWGSSDVFLLTPSSGFLNPVFLVCCDDMIRRISLFFLSIPQHKTAT